MYGVFLTVLVFSAFANAALVNNGGGLIYDTDLNITWYDAPAIGKSWQEAMDWAANLTIGGTVAGSWRLPTTPGTSQGFLQEGEWAHLYYHELINHIGGAPHNIYPFANLITMGYYWLDKEVGTGPDGSAWAFHVADGAQIISQKGNSWASYYYAVGIHDGNVGAPVPIPSAILLFAPGLVGLTILRRRLKR